MLNRQLLSKMPKPLEKSEEQAASSIDEDKAAEPALDEADQPCS